MEITEFARCNTDLVLLTQERFFSQDSFVPLVANYGIATFMLS